MHRKAHKERAPLPPTGGGPNQNCWRYYTTHLSARTQALRPDGGTETQCIIGRKGARRMIAHSNLLAGLLRNDEERPRTVSCMSWGLCSIQRWILGYSKRAHHVCAL